MKSKNLNTQEERAFARVQSIIEARVRLVTDRQAEAMKQSFAASPSVWKLRDESLLLALANQPGGDRATILAQAVLELTAQVARLQARFEDNGEPMRPASLLQLSGGGGQLSTTLPIKLGDRLEIHIRYQEGTSAIHALIEIIHARGIHGGFGFRIEAIHPHDLDRLLRLLYPEEPSAPSKSGV